MTTGKPWTVHPGVLLRAVRRARRLSQRELAANAQLPPSNIARIEAGKSMPRLETFARLLAAANYRLLIVDDHGRGLDLDVEHERLVDRGFRHFPAHLDALPMDERGVTPWWGWSRVAWLPDDKRVPSHIQVRRRRRRCAYLPDSIRWSNPDMIDDIT